MSYSLAALPTLLIVAGSASVLLGLIYWKIRRLLVRHQQRITPQLEFGKISVTHPGSKQTKGRVCVTLQNNRGGEALLETLVLRVADHGASLNSGRSRETQIHKPCPHTIVLRSDNTLYPLKPNKTCFRKAEGDEICIEFACEEQHWFRMALDCHWKNAKKPDETLQLSSAQFFLEFPVV